MANNIIKRIWNQNKMVQIEDLKGMAFQAEDGGHTFEIYGIDEAGETVTLTGTPSGVFLRPDNTDVVLDCSVSDGVVSATLPDECYDVPGRGGLTVFITADGKKTALYAAVVTVSRTSSGNVAPPATQTVVDLINAISAAVATIPASYSDLMADIAPTYSDSALYAVGQYAWYNGDLKRCIVPITTAESFTPAHWTSVVLGDDVSNLKSAFDYDITAITGAKPIVFEVGYWSTPAVGSQVTKSDHTGYRTARFPVSVGDNVTINLSGGGGSQRAYVWIDEDGNVLSRSSADLTGKRTITAPTGAVECAINNRIALQADGYYAYLGTSVPDALEEKQDILTFDNIPTLNSTNPVTSGGVYNETKRIEDVLGEQQESLSGLPITNGYYWNSETSVAVLTEYSTYKAYTPITVAPGDKMRLVCAMSGGSSKQYPFLFVDDEYTIISHEGDRLSPVDVIVIVPDNATKLLMTCGSGRICRAYKISLKPVPDNILSGTFEYKDKNIAIIGDSISTNGDYSVSNPLGNVPEIVVQDEDIGVELSAYATYYDVGTTIGGHTIVEAEVGTEITFTPVEGDQGKMVGKPKNNNSSTTDVWWEVAANVLGFNPIPVCWSGSSITDHEENVTEGGHYILKCAHSFHPSQIRKCGIRTPGSMTRTAPDMIIVYRGTNDLSHVPYSRLTNDLDSFPTTYPETDTFDDGGTTRYSFVKGMRLLIKKLHEAYPEAKIVLCTMNYFRRLSATSIYTSNGTDNWLSYNAMIRRIADFESCDLIDFAKDGLDYWNAANNYYNEGTSSSAKWTHPNTRGQARLGSRALVDLKSVNDMSVPDE